MQSMMRLFLVLALLYTLISPLASRAQNFQCKPTPPDLLGPFYKANAPVRNQVGNGYLLTGEVKSALTCAPIGDAKIELWMAGPNGQYGDEWRATIFAKEDGAYRFVTSFPGHYGGRPPHIHMIITAPGFQKLTTQHYAQKGMHESTFEIVLIPVQ